MLATIQALGLLIGEGGAGARRQTRCIFVAFNATQQLIWNVDSDCTVVGLQVEAIGIYLTTFPMALLDPAAPNIYGTGGGFICGRIGNSTNQPQICEILYAPVRAGDKVYVTNLSGGINHANIFIEL
jgi:hypothetical protein